MLAGSWAAQLKQAWSLQLLTGLCNLTARPCSIKGTAALHWLLQTCCLSNAFRAKSLHPVLAHCILSRRAAQSKGKGLRLSFARWP